MNSLGGAMASRDPIPLTQPMATYCGLAISLLGAPAFVAIFRLLTGESHSDLQVVGRDVGLFSLAALLLWIVKTQEQLPLTSIGAHINRLARSLLRGFVLGMVLLVVTVGLYLLLPKVGLHIGDSARNAFQPALWVVALAVLRAGVVEELFYRGFAIERLKSLSRNSWVASLVPLVAFAAAHYRQGLGGIVSAAILGGLLTICYLKFRDLVANMAAHFFVDFVLNVGIPLVSRA
jgi:membrane protease YdiL (CAAX protease family)